MITIPKLIKTEIMGLDIGKAMGDSISYGAIKLAMSEAIHNGGHVGYLTDLNVWTGPLVKGVPKWLDPGTVHGSLVLGVITGAGDEA